MSFRWTLTARVAGALMLAWMSAAQAHHSFARFDQNNRETLTGTLKTFKWSNPHCWMTLLVPKADGNGVDEWQLEGPPVNTLFRTGWTTGTVKSGQKVKVLMAPLKTGGPEGALLRLLEVDGVPTKVGTDSPYH